MMIDLANILARLADIRPIFHAEADFQFALAWRIRQQHPEYSVRLEFKPSFIDDRIYVDIWATDGQSVCAIETKYKTRALHTSVAGEPFDLLNQSAQDCARYDFLLDVARLERVVSANPTVVGTAIFLSNDTSYWQQPRNGNTIDAAFRIHEGRQIHGTLRWHERAAQGTTRGRETPITINGHYTLNWSNYSRPVENRYGLFRYAIASIPNNRHGDQQTEQRHTHT